jgi:serine O-acetyltransferase
MINNKYEEIWKQFIEESQEIISFEPILKDYYQEHILQHNSFEKCLIYLLAKKISTKLITFDNWIKIFNQVICTNNFINMSISDLLIIKKNDPACDSLLTAFLYFKGYKCLQLYRFAHELWISNRKQLALIIQSTCSELFGIDIHPGATIGEGFMMDHGTGIVIGETCTIGSNCCIYHGVTLGGTGKALSDRHPKVGDNVIIGCNTTILGNIPIGSNSKIGSGSIIVKPVNPFSTVLTCLAKEINKN